MAQPPPPPPPLPLQFIKLTGMGVEATIGLCPAMMTHPAGGVMVADALTVHESGVVTHGTVRVVWAIQKLGTSAELVSVPPEVWTTFCTMVIRATFPVQMVSAPKTRLPEGDW